MAKKLSAKQVTVPAVSAFKRSITKSHISALTAYDFLTAKLLDDAGVDVILVGDSLSSVVQGLKNTLPVTLDEMVYHSRCVSRAVKRALVVGDMPFMSYQQSVEKALESAGRLMKEGGVAAVKLEGGIPMHETIARLVDVDIPVMGHVGLTPQSYHRMGGHKIQGKKNGSLEAGTYERILNDAIAVEEAGAFSVVLEGVPSELAEEITAELSIPTIGIGAGVECDGQILVTQDMLGMFPDFQPRFVKRYAELASEIQSAVREYITDVQKASFPAEEHTVHLPKEAPALKVAK